MSLRNFATRLDGWLNTFMGFGGASDKLAHTRYSGCVRKLTDGELTAMYRTEHFSAKIVDVYPKEAMREGFEVGGLPAKKEAPGGKAKAGSDKEARVRAHLKAAQVLQRTRMAVIWARLYGGARVWKGSLTSDPALPFVMGEQIDFLRVVDRRYLVPRPYPLDEQGQPLYFDVIREEGGVPVGPVHASRLVPFCGARTDATTKRENQWWDDSVLQRAFDALKSEGTVWRSAEQLVSEASLGVLKIKGLHAATSNDQAREGLQKRLALFKAAKSIANNVTLDAETEDYKRDNITFAGLTDLTDAGVKRVASAAETPVAILLSDEPSGLNATGDSSIRWWLMRVHAWRVEDVEPGLLDLVQSVLAQSGIPGLTPESVRELSIKWPNLWTPSATEQADIRVKNAQADASDIDKGILTPDEAALSHYGEDGYTQEITIDRELREMPDDAALEEGAREPGAPVAPGDTGGAPAAEDVQKTALNGAQLASAQEIVFAVAKGEISRESGIALIRLGFPDVTQEEATALMGPEGFKAKEPEPSPFGGGAPGLKPPPSGPAKDEAPPAKEE